MALVLVFWPSVTCDAIVRKLVDGKLALSASAVAASPPSTDAPYDSETVNYVDVFSAGQQGYKGYRIPALVRASNGCLLAFCEARQGGDASEIDLVLRRSDDNGRTWGEMTVVCESSDFAKYLDGSVRDITVGNPAPVIDLISPDFPGRVWLPFTLENDRVFVCFSDDHGVHWSEPKEVTANVKRSDWGWYATGPVHSIQITAGKYRGRMIVPCDHRLGGAGADKGPLGAHVMLSDDFGANWRLGALDATYTDGLEANETAVVELSDGMLYFNTRDQHGVAPGNRGEAWSSDGGETFLSKSAGWDTFRPASPLLDAPVVQCSLLRTGGSRILFCGPDENGPTGLGRSDLRLRVSNDDAESFRDGPMLHVGPAAYSDMALLPDAHLGILYECGEKSAYEHVRFQWLPLADIDQD